MQKLKMNYRSDNRELIGWNRSNWRKSYFQVPLLIAGILFVLSFTSCKKFKQNTEQTKLADSKTSLLSTSGATGDEFTIVVFGDTQNYVDYGNDPDDSDCQPITPFQNMVDWVITNKTTENIKYVVSLGDITDNYGATDAGAEGQWIRAHDTYEPLKTAGIPFGVVPGNHDINFASGGNYPNNGTTFPASPFFHKYFGRPQFPSYNKAGYPNSYSNQNHYDVISTPAGDFMILYLRWQHMKAEALPAYDWAFDMMSLPENANKKIIVVTHYTVGGSDANLDGKKDWGEQCYQTPCFSQGSDMYNKFKSFPNFFMFLGGHATGEDERQDTYKGKTVKSFTTDYSASCNPASSSNYPPGVIRTMKFSASKDLIEFKTFLPGQTPIRVFTKPWNRGFTTVRTNDYDNNGKSELALFNAGTFKKAAGNISFPSDPMTGDIPVPADYNGSGNTIPAVYRPSTNQWIAQGKGYVTFPVTVVNGIPVPGDYDGNGTVDYVLYEPSTGKWHERQTYLTGDYKSTTYGVSTDIPIAADYDGDGKTNYSLFRPATGSTKAEFIMYSFRRQTVGAIGDVLIPVPGDYNGDGRVDCATYNQNTNTFIWYKMLTETDTPVATSVVFGAANAIPAPGDYNGDGKTDFAYYLNGTLFVKDGTNVTFGGTTGDKLLNLPFHIRKFFFP